MVIVCQQCGDRGFYEGLIECEKCHSTAVHIYCLPVLPASFQDDVVWYCEDCEPKVSKPSTADNRSSVLVGKCDSEKLKIIQANQSSLRFDKNAADSLNKNKRKSVACGLSAKPEVRKSRNVSSHHLPVHHSNNNERDQRRRRLGELNGRNINEEAESVKTKTSLILSVDSKCNPHYSRQLLSSESDKNYEKLERQIGLDGRSSDDKAESFRTRTSKLVANDTTNTLECSSNAHNEPVIEVPRSGNGKNDYQLKNQRELVKSSSDSETSDSETKSLKYSLVNTSNSLSIQKHSSNACEKSIVEVQCMENVEKDSRLLRQSGLDGASSDEGTRCSRKVTPFVASTRPSSVLEHCHTPAPSHPISEPIWRGNLHLSRDRYFTIEGMVAHLSTSACSRVFQEAKLLPQLLCAEMLPRSCTWPKSFQKWGPTDADIALYLFPNNYRSEEVYDSLVDDMICYDIALRAVAKNAELLLFTSNLLPLHFWRFRSKLYLWGVFRAKRTFESRALAVYPLNAIPASKTNDVVKALTWNPRSPASPLSNCGSDVSGSVHSSHSVL